MPGDSLNADMLYPEPLSTSAWIGGGIAAATTSQTPTASNTSQFWIPVWSGEVLNAYDQYNVFEPLVKSDTIQSGTTKRFPVTGTVGATPIWAAGQELVGDSSATAPGFFDISLDSRPMASHFELDDIATMITQWDYRSELARQAGLQLSYMRDKQLASMIAIGAVTAGTGHATTNYGGMNQGTVVLAPNVIFNKLGLRGASASDRTDAALLVLDYIERYMVRLSEIDATLSEVYCAVSPQAFHDIRALGIARVSGDLFGGSGRPFFGGVAEAGGLGAGLQSNLFGLGETLLYMGVVIVKSNHLAQLDQAKVQAGLTNVASNGIDTATGQYVGGTTDKVPVIGDLGDAKYNFNWYNATTGTEIAVVAANGTPVAGAAFLPVKALIWQKSAVCSLRLQGLKVESVKDVRRGTFFTVSSMMSGAGVLRPELCGVFQGTYTAS